MTLENQNTEQEFTPEVIVQNSIKQYDLPEAKIAEIKDFCEKIVIAGVDDKEGYKLAKDAKNKVIKYRTAIEAKRKSLNEDSQTVIKGINGEAKRLTSLITPIEEMMVNKLKEIDDEVELLKIKDRETKENILKEAGFYFDNVNWFACDIIVSPQQLQDYPLNFIMDAAERGKKALKEKADAKALEERTAKRVFNLIGIGFWLNAMNEYEYETFIVGQDAINTLTDIQFGELYTELKTQIDARKETARIKAEKEKQELEDLRKFKEQKEAEEKQKRGELRRKELTELGYINKNPYPERPHFEAWEKGVNIYNIDHNDISLLNDDEWNTLIADNEEDYKIEQDAIEVAKEYNEALPEINLAQVKHIGIDDSNNKGHEGELGLPGTSGPDDSGLMTAKQLEEQYFKHLIEQLQHNGPQNTGDSPTPESFIITPEMINNTAANIQQGFDNAIKQVLTILTNEYDTPTHILASIQELKYQD